MRPELLRWARQRANLKPEYLTRRFGKLTDWEQGKAKPTLKQLEAFANGTQVPIGCLFLPEPPVETLPIPDFRTGRRGAASHPSPNLLDTIHLCQQRQTWYRDYARSTNRS